MAFYSNSETMYNSNCSDKSKSKVYINPNFNRPSIYSCTSSTVMHVNPNFTHLQNFQSNSHNMPKIYVNPNFMKSKCTPDDFKPKTSAIMNSTQITVQVPIAKSRYCLVRQNVTKTLQSSQVEKPKNTYQVNKYKSILLNDVKKNLNNIKNDLNKHSTPVSNKKYLDSTVANLSTNQFKLINPNTTHSVRNDKLKMRTFIDTHRKVPLSESSLNKVKGFLKKNNIPCPMFRKFGKCLRREIRGKCEFLHDKKHVSICRKFIKGRCHDKECLLSHDLTTKKMPTCYFYLQGTCNKPDCPYLHVKLNEKAKICQDFLKGYCEKGSKCLLRHVNITSDKKIKDSLVTRSSALKRKYSKRHRNTEVINAISTQGNEISITEKNEKHLDYRYYQESKHDVNVTETCEIIKPTRCKLGTLPSFIEL